jgi:hypothetical protein
MHRASDMSGECFPQANDENELAASANRLDQHARGLGQFI